MVKIPQREDFADPRDYADAVAAFNVDHRNFHPIFRFHNCARCRNGERPCIRGSESRCEWPRARND